MKLRGFTALKFRSQSVTWGRIWKSVKKI